MYEPGLSITAAIIARGSWLAEGSIASPAALSSIHGEFVDRIAFQLWGSDILVEQHDGIVGQQWPSYAMIARFRQLEVPRRGTGGTL